MPPSRLPWTGFSSCLGTEAAPNWVMLTQLCYLLAKKVGVWPAEGPMVTAGKPLITLEATVALQTPPLAPPVRNSPQLGEKPQTGKDKARKTVLPASWVLPWRPGDVGGQGLCRSGGDNALMAGAQQKLKQGPGDQTSAL